AGNSLSSSSPNLLSAHSHAKPAREWGPQGETITRDFFPTQPAFLSDQSQSRYGPTTYRSARLFILYLRAAFSALLSFNKSRSFMRALCNCDLLFPIEHPIISAISLCSYPSTSCSTKMILYPGGRLSMPRSRVTRSIDPASTSSLAPIP